MGAAYFMVLDNKKPGFDTFVNGKAISRDSAAIANITKRLKIADINDLTSFASRAAEFGVDPNSPGAQEKWFTADEGLAWVHALQGFITKQPSSVKAADRVLAELEEYKELLERSHKIGARWHFEIDF